MFDVASCTQHVVVVFFHLDLSFYTPPCVRCVVIYFKYTTTVCLMRREQRGNVRAVTKLTISLLDRSRQTLKRRGGTENAELKHFPATTNCDLVATLFLPENPEF